MGTVIHGAAPDYQDRFDELSAKLAGLSELAEKYKAPAKAAPDTNRFDELSTKLNTLIERVDTRTATLAHLLDTILKRMDTDHHERVQAMAKMIADLREHLAESREVSKPAAAPVAAARPLPSKPLVKAPASKLATKVETRVKPRSR